MAGRPKGTGKIAKELSPADVHRIDKWLTGTRHELRNRAILYLGLGTGMRISEIIGLRIKDVAPHGRILNEIVLEKHRTKSKQTRTVMVSDQATFHLKTWLDSRSLTLDLLSPVFPSQKDPRKPMNANWCVQMMTQIFHDAGVANATTHSLRRTHINELDRSGARIKAIQEQVGHTNISTTHHYLVAPPAERKKVVKRIKF